MISENKDIKIWLDKKNEINQLKVKGTAATLVLKYLIINNNIITHLDLSSQNGCHITNEQIKLLAVFIKSNNCKLTHLKLRYNGLGQNDESNKFAVAFKKNKSITYLDLHDNGPIIHGGTLNDFIKCFSKSIKNHPKIKSINLGRNGLTNSIIDLTNNIPKSVKHLNLSINPDITDSDIGYLIQNTKLMSLKLIGKSPYTIFPNILHIISSNRSLVKLKYHWFASDMELAKKLKNQKSIMELVDKTIESMLTRNRLAYDMARNAALCFIGITKFRIFIPKEIALMIAKNIFASYCEDVTNESSNKKICL